MAQSIYGVFDGTVGAGDFPQSKHGKSALLTGVVTGRSGFAF